MINVKTGLTKPRVRKKRPNMATLYHSNATRIMKGAFGIAPSHLAAAAAAATHSDFRRVNYFREREDTDRSINNMLDRRTVQEI